MSIRFRAMVLAGLAGIGSVLIAQQSTPEENKLSEPTLRITARTVLVDVVVTDKKNNAVSGLKKEDFKISENGKPQSIDFFEPHFQTAGPIRSTDPLPPNTFTNVPQAPPNEAINVLLMDAMNTPTADQAYVRLQMMKYLADLPSDVRMGIFLLGNRLSLVQGFTQDSNVLRASIRKFAANPSSSALLSTPAQQAAEGSGVNMIAQMAIDTKNPRDTGSSSALMESAQAFQAFLNQERNFEYNQRLLISLESLQTIARYLHGVPGRKNLLWFAGNIPVCVPDKCVYIDLVEKTRHMLAESRVAVYPIDAAGVVAPHAEIGGSAGGQVSIPDGSDSLLGPSKIPPSQFLAGEEWAGLTGGKAYHGNAFVDEISSAIHDGSLYYTLAYTPTDSKEIGRERKINVQLKSGEYKLAYRRSYIELTPKEIKTAQQAEPKDPLRPLMDRGMPNFSEVQYRVHVESAAQQPTAGAALAGDNTALKGPVTRYTVRFAVSPDSVSLVQGPDGVRRATIEVALMAYNQAGASLNWQVRSVGLAIRPEQMAIAQSSGIPFHFDFDVPQGDVYLRTGIYDTAASKAGTLEIPLSAVTIAKR